MDKDQNTSHETVEDKISKTSAEAKEASQDKPDKEKAADNKKTAEEKKPEAAMDNNKEAESAKEGLNESDMIDINKESEKKDEANKPKRGYNGHKAPKSTDDFIAKQKKRKRIRRLITLGILAILLIAGVLWIKNAMNKAKDALAGLAANNVQTAFVEKKTLYDSKDATGTLYALDSRTISRALAGTGQSGADIVAVNVEVGDHVTAGDVLVEFSSEDIEKKINETKEDIGTKKQLQAIKSEDSQRNYVSKYESAATSMKTTALDVDRKLEALHEACDAYGDAKRERDKYKQETEDDGHNINEEPYKSQHANLQSKVDSAYQAQQQAQRAYDDAVAAQAEGQGSGISSIANSLSDADSQYKQDQINFADEVKKDQRTLNNYVDSLDDYVVHATISGVVTEVNVSEGNTFTSGNVLTIQDDSGYEVAVLIDEYDIPKIKKAYNEKKASGQELEVVVKTEATGDNEYKGHVKAIAPTSTSTTAASVTVSASSNGVTSTASLTNTANYKVSIVLDETDDAFMIGMTAKVAIVVNQSPENALCVPYNCVEEVDGKYIVKVMDENGDKNTADDVMPGMSSLSDGKGARGGKSDNKGVNGIVIENDAKDSNKSDSDKKPKLFGKNKKGEDIPTGRRYREVEVDKLFDTDFYVAVVPKNDGSLKEGDEVMIVTEKASGNDIMAMFGGPGGF